MSNFRKKDFFSMFLAYKMNIKAYVWYGFIKTNKTLIYRISNSLLLKQNFQLNKARKKQNASSRRTWTCLKAVKDKCDTDSQ